MFIGVETLGVKGGEPLVENDVIGVFQLIPDIA